MVVDIVTGILMTRCWFTVTCGTSIADSLVEGMNGRYRHLPSENIAMHRVATSMDRMAVLGSVDALYDWPSTVMTNRDEMSPLASADTVHDD